jgi:hypothetical protein
METFSPTSWSSGVAMRIPGELSSLGRLALAGWIALFAVGCGPRLEPVRGKVLLADGQPAVGSQVVFEGQFEGKAITARGDVRADGSFEMGTYAPGDGVPPGKYRVQVNPPPVVNADAPMQLPFAKKYANFETSGLEFEVKPGEPHELLLKLDK